MSTLSLHQTPLRRSSTVWARCSRPARTRRASSTRAARCSPRSSNTTTGCPTHSRSPTRALSAVPAVSRPGRAVLGRQLRVGAGPDDADPQPHGVGLIGCCAAASSRSRTGSTQRAARAGGRRRAAAAGRNRGRVAAHRRRPSRDQRVRRSGIDQHPRVRREHRQGRARGVPRRRYREAFRVGLFECLMRDARCLMQRPHARPVAGTRRQAEIHPFRFSPTSTHSIKTETP